MRCQQCSIEIAKKSRRDVLYCSQSCRRKAYYSKNKKTILDRVKKYADSNKRIISERSKKYYRANRTHLKSKSSKYYLANRALILEQRREAQKNPGNRERRAKYDSEHRAIIRSQDKAFRSIPSEHNKKKEREFVHYRRDEILAIMNSTCNDCERPVEHIHHKTYEGLPKNSLRSYCEFLVPYCEEHHVTHHRLLREEKRLKALVVKNGQSRARR